jgi:hypothetical protein
MKKKIVPIVALLLLLCSCTKDNLDNLDYFSFGNAYGFCQGNCTNFFIIQDDSIYPDDMDLYVEPMKFKSEALSIEKYNLARKLIDNFPSYLIANPNKTFGCPDCADQGGIHIEIKENGEIMRWHFDTVISKLPSKIQDYVKEISDVIEQLK